jgi:hypothetical protein
MNTRITHLVSVIVLTGCLFFALTFVDDEIIKNEVVKQEPIITTSTKKLYSDYEANFVVADIKHKKKVLQIT